MRALRFMKKVPREDLRAELVMGIIKMTVRLEGRGPDTDFKAWPISELRKRHDLLIRQCRWWDSKDRETAND
tara:strand:+ start:5689 stop:5904 length:216 start_codon:yes stop_codon:yes gene_type:complete